MKARAVHTGQRMAPMADQAKVVAAQRIEDARYWAAPRLESAAHGFEDQVAPRVSSMLTTAARKIDPTPSRSRRWPMFMLLTGLAVGTIGYMFYRRNAQQWTEHMKDSASDASRWVNEKADRTSESADRMAANVSNRADEASRKMS
ncbi:MULTISPECIES: YtxH domain-containing protein [unclassified Nonomuraea]